MLGAIGVIASLLYLATQIRQNSRSLRGQAQVALMEATRSLLSELRLRPDIADVNIRLSNSWENAKDPSELRIATWFNLDEALHNELAFVLWQQGIIDEAAYLRREDYWLGVLLMPGKRAWWDNYRYYLHPDYIERINGKLAELDQMDAAAKGRLLAGLGHVRYPNVIHFAFDENFCC